MSQKNCAYCGRNGLLIYPVRYAVACPGGADGVPGLSGNFKIVDAPQEIGEVKYTLRALRPGYLYTYDEKRNRLKSYVVMDGGHLWNFPNDLLSPDLNCPKMSCVNPVEIALSFCVDVRHSDNDPAGNFWLGWSSSVWTEALRKQVGNAEWRGKHMQCIDVPTMFASSVPHAGEFKSCYESIAHFAADAKALKKAFGFSNTAVEQEMLQRRWAKKFLSAFALHIPYHKGFVAAVNDPVAITNDLSELTVPTASSGFDETVYRGKIIDDMLRSTELAVRENAREEFIGKNTPAPVEDTITYKANYHSWGSKWRDAVRSKDSMFRKEYEEKKQKFENSLEANLRKAEDQAWHDLTYIDEKPILDEHKRKSFPEAYEHAVKAFEPKAYKLADAHHKWLCSAQLAKWLEGVHDSYDIRSGFAFRESVAQCIGKAAGTLACQGQLKEWMNSPNVADTANLYARALLFNQTAIANAAEPHVKGGDVKLKNILSVYKGALERLDKGIEEKLIDRLVLTTANVFVTALSVSSKTVMKNMALISLSLLSKTTISSSNLSARDVRDWAISQVKEQGIKLDTPRSETKAAALKEAKKVVPRVSSEQSQALCAYELDVAALESEGRIKPGTLKAIRIPGIKTTKEWMQSSSTFNLGCVSAVLQLVALCFAVKDFKKSDRFDENFTGGKAIVASVSLAASIVEVAAATAAKSPQHPLSVYLNNHWLVGKKPATRLIVAKGVGMIAGVVTSLFDLYSAYKAMAEQDYVLMGLYGVSAVLGSVLAIGSFAVGATFFWPLFVSAVVIAIVISQVKKSLLKTWLTRCFYAANASEGTGSHYGDLEEELKAYGNAVESM